MQAATISYIAARNNLKDEEKQYLLATLRRIALAPTRETNDQAISNLRNSTLYKDNAKVKTYVETRWLNITKVPPLSWRYLYLLSHLAPNISGICNP